MIWIFAATVLILAVYSKGFRRFVYWCGGAALLCCIGIVIFVLVHDFNRREVTSGTVVPADDLPVARSISSAPARDIHKQ